ncbi:MAG: hypothetical protein EON90_00865 [Brevundimonas sp.]|nr:MAG: hypothetical protein EON90_00865 [Brevundimonas sp.]
MAGFRALSFRAKVVIAFVVMAFIGVAAQRYFGWPKWYLAVGAAVVGASFPLIMFALARLRVKRRE